MEANREIRELIRRIAENDDKKAFEIFFRHYHPKLIRFSLMFLDSYQDAEDVVSEVMIKLLRQRKKLTDIVNFEGYLFLAIRNQSLNALQKNFRIQKNIDKDIPQDHLANNFYQPIEKLLEEELRQLIFQAVEKLPPQRRMVYKLVKDDGMKCSEAASLLKIAEKTAKKHLELALKDLRMAIIDYFREKKSDIPIIDIGCKTGMVLLAISIICRAILF